MMIKFVTPTGNLVTVKRSKITHAATQGRIVTIFTNTEDRVNQTEVTCRSALEAQRAVYKITYGYRWPIFWFLRGMLV